MSQLIHLKHRIKAVGTIKKITGAMRLISRSFHTRMHKEARFMNDYSAALQKTAAQIRFHLPEAEQNTSFLTGAQTHKELVILIGSQKGLCGSYNSSITYWIDAHKDRLRNSSITLFVIGKRIEEHLKKNHLSIDRSFPELKLSTVASLTDQLFETFSQFSKVTVISNKPKSFVSYECKETNLIPGVSIHTTQGIGTPSFDYTWTHDPQVVLNTVVKTQLKTSLYSLLFFSLSGEQSARFIAMDNAMRNANKFLDTMKLQFNKMRQAKITKELTELAGAFETQSGI